MRFPLWSKIQFKLFLYSERFQKGVFCLSAHRRTFLSIKEFRQLNDTLKTAITELEHRKVTVL